MKRTKLAAVTTVASALSIGACGPMNNCAPPPQPTASDCAQRAIHDGHLAVVGLVADGTLICFQDGAPGHATPIAAVTGLVGDTALVGMDYRPANDVLYAVGNAGGIYSIDVASAVASKVATLSVALEGSAFGVDFNPTVDRLRIVSDTGQNLRVNVDDGVAAVDTPLSIPGTTPVNPATGITGAAYTNNDADPNTATTLFDMDVARDQTAVQAPANAGTLSPTGKLLSSGRGGRLRHLQRDEQRHHGHQPGSGVGAHHRRGHHLVQRRPADRSALPDRRLRRGGHRRRHPDGAALSAAAHAERRRSTCRMS